MENSEPRPIYERIYDLVRQVPAGKVITYGQVAYLAGGCSARMVGYAMAALKEKKDEAAASVPWQRVINRMGKISPHGLGLGSAIQRTLLEEEGITFDANDRIDLARFGWIGKEGIARPE